MKPGLPPGFLLSYATILSGTPTVQRESQTTQVPPVEPLQDSRQANPAAIILRKSGYRHTIYGQVLTKGAARTPGLMPLPMVVLLTPPE